MIVSENSGDISIDPGKDHKVDAFSTDSAAKPPVTKRHEAAVEKDKRPDESANIEQETADWEDEGGSPPDRISAVDGDGRPPEPTAEPPADDR